MIVFVTLQLVVLLTTPVTMPAISRTIDPRAINLDYSRFPTVTSARTNKRIQRDSGNVRVRRGATVNTSNLWPNGVIPFVISHDYPGTLLHMIYESMMMWMEGTCLYFTEGTRNHHSWLEILPGACGCCSQVGRQTIGAQYLYLGDECDTPGIMAHEFGHAIGFWHEHTRPDRDDYIYIVDENIENEQKYNFLKKSYDDVDSLGEPYDANSIMHYAPNTFAKGGMSFTVLLRERGDQTLTDHEFLNAMGQLGQRIRPSEGDISQTNKLYRCPPCGGNVLLGSGLNWTTVEPTDNILHCQYCGWRLIVSSGSYIQLRIDKINLFRGQFGIIYDSYQRDYNLLGYINGREQIFRPGLLSTTSVVFVELWGSRVSEDVIDVEPSFSVSAKAVCGGTVNSLPGILANPGYPHQLKNHAVLCNWKIVTRPDEIVVVTFKKLQIRGQPYDKASLTLFEGSRSIVEVAPVIRQIYNQYGSNQWTFFSTTNAIQVALSTSSSTTTLMYAKYRTRKNPCGIMNGGCEQLCVVTKKAFMCACDVGYWLMPDLKSCTTYQNIYELIDQYVDKSNTSNTTSERTLTNAMKLLMLGRRRNGRIVLPMKVNKAARCGQNSSVFKWTVESPQESILVFKFRRFRVGKFVNGRCVDDKLSFAYLDTDGSLLITTEFCGSVIPRAFTSLGSKVNLTCTVISKHPTNFVVDYFIVPE